MFLFRQDYRVKRNDYAGPFKFVPSAKDDYLYIFLFIDHSRPQSPRFVWSAIETRGSGNRAYWMS